MQVRFHVCFIFVLFVISTICQFGWNPLKSVSFVNDDDKILALSKLIAFVNNKSNDTQTIEFVFHREENIVRKGENAGYQHFLLFPHCF